MKNRRRDLEVYALILFAAFLFRFAVARFLANDAPNDGKIYAQMARNMLEQHVYSHATEPPFEPSIIRLPGYPLFLAGIYSVFGHHNDTAIRIVQAVIDTASCALIALIAYYWEPDEKRKRRSSIAALILAAACPFTTIYAATILTEVPTIFLALAMTLTATLAFRAGSQKRARLFWALTGLVAGVAVLFRPDSGLFAAAIGITLVGFTPIRARDESETSRRPKISRELLRTASFGAILSVAFVLVLVPWTVRNWRVFHVFQPLAPAHAEMPGEFVSRGYFAWLRTWVDDQRYIEPLLWSLDEAPIKIQDVPDRAFDSAAEKARVAALLDRYNHPPEEQPSPEPTETPLSPRPLDQVPPPSIATSKPSPVAQPSPSPSPSLTDKSVAQTKSGNQSPTPSASAEETDQADEEDQGDETDQGDSGDQTQPADEQQAVEMTPEIDAGFAQLARERIKRAPLRYYLWLPAKRAAALWFNTHSQYYPFDGQLFPLDDLDHDSNQQFWLPLFAGLTWAYTMLGIIGGWLLWRSKSQEAQRFLVLAGLMIILRLAFFATLENPEPRYVVEAFPFLSILGGIAVTGLPDLITGRRSSRS